MNLSEDEVKWLGSGERGISSNTIFQTLTEFPALAGWMPDYPHDPADFRRCLLLLEAVPEFKSRFYKMESVSSVWKGLVEHWDALQEMFESEVTNWRSPYCGGSAPKTYDMMKTIMASYR